MSPSLDSPIQTQMAVEILRNPLMAERHGSSNMEGKKSNGKRRVFVQTDTGCVLGLELHRSDNAHMVKRKLQLALNVPTEESSLTFGDMVLENDLSAIRKGSPLLLTRNAMHRSSSTPCLSPTGSDIHHRDTSGPIEVLGDSDCLDTARQMVREIVKGIKHGVEPIPVQSGLGGAYYFRDTKGECVAIVKPTDEEPFAPNNPKGFVGKALGQPGLKPSVRVGETGVREVAAYLLDDGHFANVPATVLVKVTHSIFNINDGVNGNINKTHKKKPVSKIASFQQFIPHDFDASDHGTSSFPVSAVHRIGILDIRIFNTDRHAGNLLVKKLDTSGRFGKVELIPIDHGLCLPESLEDPYFEWIHWPQASIPFSSDELEYINNLNPRRDCEMLRKELPMIREACLRVLVLSTIFLKEAASYGLCLAEIGEMMTREFRNGDEDPSELELICLEARRLVAAEREHPPPSPSPRAREDDLLFDMDFYWNTKNPLSRLMSVDEEEDENEEEDSHIINKISTSLRNNSLEDKTMKYHEMKPLKVTTSLGQRSADEQLPASASFVKVADMGEAEWTAFLDKFKELLRPAFGGRRAAMAGPRPRQRLGTSCQF